MDGSCDYCHQEFKHDDAVVNISYSTWDEDDGRMRDDFDREDFIVHTSMCLVAFTDSVPIV